jgi:uncharacterized protein (DUF2384 family)
MSEQPVNDASSVLEELARDQRAAPVADIAELRADVWSSEAELQEFLSEWRAARDASLS